MSEADEILSVVRAWVHKAEHDLAGASYMLGMGAECPAEIVCFHAQQCAEKYLKALLVSEGIDFPRTHDIGALVALLPTRQRPQLAPAQQRRLTDYATVTRYPGDYDPVPLAEAREAVRVSRSVRRHVRKLLPRAALRSETA